MANFHLKQAKYPNYYWRDFTGAIPPDAINGGKDVNGRPTYIGQALLKGVGIIPGTIYPNVLQILLPNLGKAEASDMGTKILCGKNTRNFVWEKANAKTLHLTTVNKILVVGGCQGERKLVNIGRIKYQGEIVVGKVVSHQVENAKMFFCFGNNEIGVSDYEILTYAPIMEGREGGQKKYC